MTHLLFLSLALAAAAPQPPRFTAVFKEKRSCAEAQRALLKWNLKLLCGADADPVRAYTAELAGPVRGTLSRIVAAVPELESLSPAISYESKK